VLGWDGSTFTSRRHVDGSIPAMVDTTASAAIHTSEGTLAGAVVRDGRLLVVGRDGQRRLVVISAARR
jgi:hypothetical protein